MHELWKLLLSAQENGGIPPEFLEQARVQLERKHVRWLSIREPPHTHESRISHPSYTPLSLSLGGTCQYRATYQPERFQVLNATTSHQVPWPSFIKCICVTHALMIALSLCLPCATTASSLKQIHLNPTSDQLRRPNHPRLQSPPVRIRRPVLVLVTVIVSEIANGILVVPEEIVMMIVIVVVVEIVIAIEEETVIEIVTA